jgi:putative acetyltransferase
MPELKQAITLYEKSGFAYLHAPMGNSGHTGCGIWMSKVL